MGDSQSEHALAVAEDYMEGAARLENVAYAYAFAFAQAASVWQEMEEDGFHRYDAWECSRTEAEASETRELSIHGMDFYPDDAGDTCDADDGWGTYDAALAASELLPVVLDPDPLSRVDDVAHTATNIFADERSVGRTPNPAQADLLRDIFGNPFRPKADLTPWLAADVVALARSIYAGRAFDRMPELAEALGGAGCTAADALAHCRSPGEHARGCWVLDLVLSRT